MDVQHLSACVNGKQSGAELCLLDQRLTHSRSNCAAGTVLSPPGWGGGLPACQQATVLVPCLSLCRCVAVTCVLTRACAAAGWRATVSGLAEKFARPLPTMPEASNGLQPGPMPDSNGHAHNGLEGGLEQIFPNSNHTFDSARHTAMRQQSLHQQLHDRQKNRVQFHKVLAAPSTSACLSELCHHTLWRSAGQGHPFLAIASSIDAQGLSHA